jgi:hypothetical protein
MGAYWVGRLQTFKSLAQSDTCPQLISAKIGIATSMQEIYLAGAILKDEVLYSYLRILSICVQFNML